ncbi:MAG: G5 domain-containing protein [Candidatus Saccharimonadales bacterium]|jgi:hypothetical protein
MNGVFVLLFLASLVGLVWGVIAPHHIAKVSKIKRPITRAHTFLFFGCLVLLFTILTSLTAPPVQQHAATVASFKTSASSGSKPQVKGASISTKQETETQPIPFAVNDENDSSLPKGQTKVTQSGKNGVKALTYKVTYTDGKQTNKTLVSSVVTMQPVVQTVEIGAYVPPAPSTHTTIVSTPHVTSPTPAPTPVPPPAPTPTPAPTQSCHPLTNGGNCYEPGEYCRNSDHGIVGLAGDGKIITCAYNNGWRWEP